MSASTIDISKCVQICRILDNIVSDGFGPQGLQTLMTTSTGQVMVTNHGTSIYNSLHISHPVGRVVMGAVQKAVSYTGDGSKVFVLMLTEALHQIYILSREFRLERQIFIRGIVQFKNNIYPKLVQYYKQNAQILNFSSGKSAFCNQMEGILRGIISPHYSSKNTDIFVKVLISLFDFRCQGNELIKQMDILVHDFDSFVVKVNGFPYTDSRVINSFVIEKDFVAFSEKGAQSSCKFIILLSTIEGNIESEQGELIGLSSNTGLSDFMKYQRKRVERFIKMCTEDSINLVISTVQIPKYCLQMLHHHKISVIHLIDENDADFLSQVWGKFPVSHLTKKSFAENEIFEATSFRRIIINGKPCIQIVPCAGEIYPKTLLMTAPTEGLSSQLYTTLHKALKCLFLSLFRNFSEKVEIDQKDPCTLITVPGGGNFEILSGNFLLDISRGTEQNDYVEICRLLGHALLNVAQALHKNTSVIQRNVVQDFLTKITYINQQIISGKDGSKLLGFNRRGEVKNMVTEGVLESFSVKLHIFCSVLELLSTLLKTDSIIGVCVNRK